MNHPQDERAVVGEEDSFQTDRVLTISAGHAVHDTYTAFLPPLLPVLIERLALSKAEAGLLTVFVQGPSLLQPLIGHLADQANLRTLVVLAPAVTAAMMSLVGVAPSYGVLVLLLVVTGASSASLHAIGPVMAGRLSGRKLGRGMGFWMVGGELGRTLGPIFIVSGIQLLGLNNTPWLMTAGFLVSALLYLRLRDAPVHLPGSGNGLPWRRALRGMRPLLGPLAGIIIARSFLSSVLTTYLPTFLSEEGTALWLAGASLSILEAAGVVGALAGGSISDRLGRRSVLFASMLATPLLMFLFMAAGGWLRLLLLLLMGFSGLSVTPVIMALVQECFPENRALANGVYMAMSFVLRSAVVVMVGALADRFGLRAAYVASTATGLLGLPIILLLPGRRSRRNTRQDGPAGDG